jgi:hypothetical protein
VLGWDLATFSKNILNENQFEDMMKKKEDYDKTAVKELPNPDKVLMLGVYPKNTIDQYVIRFWFL